MQSPPHIKGIAARAGRWSAAHRKTAILGWFAFVLAALAIGGAVGTDKLTQSEAAPGESGRAERALEAAGLSPATESVLVRSETATVADASFRAAVAGVVDRVSKLEDVRDVRSPLDGAGAISRDRHAALVEFELAGPPKDAADKVEPVLDAVAAAARAHPEVTIAQFGTGSVEKGLNERFSEDLHKAEALSVPITLLILVVAFGTLVAAGVPVLLGISAVAATVGLIAIPSQVFPVDDNVASVILLVGLAVGVDYSLFYIQRMREERAKGASSRDALAIAASTSGRAVLISGLTVMTAMAGLFLTGDGTFTSFGLGTMLVVAVAIVASLTVLPAVLASLGDRVEKGRIPFTGRLRRSGGGAGVWAAVADRAMRRPALALALGAGLLVALAIPTLSLKTEVGGVDSLPGDLAVVRAYDEIQESFPGDQTAAIVAVQSDDVRSPEVVRAIERLRSEASSSGDTVGPVTVERSADRGVAEMTVPIAGTGNDERSKQALAGLRGDLIPASFEGVDARVDVTGTTAQSVDFNSLLSGRLPIVFGFVLGFAFLLMMTTFRSIVIPIKTIALNLLSVGAAYGVLVLVFQEGLGESALGFESTGAIASWLPLFMFVILFGLSMDYHVFILSRVREAVDRGMGTDDAIRHGIRSTAGVVTSAAIVMVAVFAIFGTLSFVQMKQMGVGLAVAVLIDATIVRAVILPAAMKLLGERNWYLPRRLGWIPEVRHEPAPEPARA